MKKVVEIIIRWLIITIVFLFVYQMTKGQCCEDFSLLRRDTVLKQSSISVIEVPPGKQARLTFEPITAVVTYTDNVSPLMIYSGAWTNGNTTAKGFQHNTIAWSNTVGNTVTFNFSGSKLEWFSEYLSTHGRALVTVNGIPMEINLAKFNTGPSIVAEWNLPKGNYTVVIRVLDAKPVVHDGFRVTN